MSAPQLVTLTGGVVAALPGKRRDDVYGLKYEFLLDYGGGDVQDGEYWPLRPILAALRLLESVHPNALSLEQRWVTGTNLPVTKPTRARKGRKRPRTAAEQDGQWRANKTNRVGACVPLLQHVRSEKRPNGSSKRSDTKRTALATPSATDAISLGAGRTAAKTTTVAKTVAAAAAQRLLPMIRIQPRSRRDCSSARTGSARRHQACQC